jgi:hypothetical protein
MPKMAICSSKLAIRRYAARGFTGAAAKIRAGALQARRGAIDGRAQE